MDKLCRQEEISIAVEDYLVEQEDQFGLYVVRPAGRGPAPKELSGSYTTPALAKRAIENYCKTPKKAKALKANAREKEAKAKESNKSKK